MTRAKSKPSIPNRAAGKASRTSNGSAAKPVRAIKAAAKPARAAAAKPPQAAPAASKAKVPVGAARTAVLSAPLAVKSGAAAVVGVAKRLGSEAVVKGVAKGVAKGADTPTKLRPIEQAVGVSSDAVARRTGKSWAEWFALLDAAGAAELDHKGIVAVLPQRHGVGPWWQQMVTVAYEQARGKREKHETEEGYQVGVSKTLELPLAKLFRFWVEPSERNKWLADDRFAIHKATASKSIRARWGRGVSRIDVDFYDKGAGKSQVTVQHNRIETPDAAEQMKAYWAKKIRALEALVTRA